MGTPFQLRFQSAKAHSHDTGTDHQRIAKIDRENEVTAPPKVSPSVGKVSVPQLSMIIYK